jgi:hypothetical protein
VLDLGGLEPWDDIHTVNAGVIFSLDISDEFTITGGPVAQFAREAGTDWNDGFTAGGVVGMSYKFSSDFSLGGGAVITSQIEDNVRVAPFIIISWDVNDDFKVVSQAGERGSGVRGTEVVYNPEGAWEFAFGGSYQFSRFRLDDDGPAPDGVGEEETLPLWLRASCNLGPQLRVDGLFGVNTSGYARLEDDEGGLIEERDYDPALFFGVYGSVQF